MCGAGETLVLPHAADGRGGSVRGEHRRPRSRRPGVARSELGAISPGLCACSCYVYAWDSDMCMYLHVSLGVSSVSRVIINRWCCCALHAC